MGRIAQVPSSWLVALQFVLIGALLLTASPPRAAALLGTAVALLAASAAIGISALAANRPGNFNIRPELKLEAKLVTLGIYRWIRHPMYSAVLAAMLATVVTDPLPWRIVAWLALVGVLIAKAQREEGYLRQRFAQYEQYQATTWRLLPWVW